MTRFLLGITAVLAVDAAGCDGCAENKSHVGSAVDAEVTANPASSTSASGGPSASASARHERGLRNRFGSGPTGTLFTATRTLADLTAEQKAKIDEIGRTLQGEDTNPRDEMRGVHEALAFGVKAGKIDGAKLEPLMKEVDKAALDRHDKEAAALESLHKALVPAQRTLIVKDIRDKTAAHEARLAARGDAGSGRNDDGSIFLKVRLSRLTKDLDLDAEQQKKAEAALPKTAPKLSARAADERRRLDVTLAAFDKDDFHAKMVPAPDPKFARGMLDQEQAFLSAILPVLKPEQREKLASQLDRGGGGQGGHRGGPGGPHRPSHSAGASDDDHDLN